MMRTDAQRERLLQEAAAELEDDRARLRETAAELAADERAFAQAQALEGGIAGDSADIASDVAEQEQADRLGREVHARLLEVEDALVRLAVGSYGRCEDCGQPIDPARLRALPTARRCLDCQRHHELAGAVRMRRHSRAR